MTTNENNQTVSQDVSQARILPDLTQTPAQATPAQTRNRATRRAATKQAAQATPAKQATRKQAAAPAPAVATISAARVIAEFNIPAKTGRALLRKHNVSRNDPAAIRAFFKSRLTARAAAAAAAAKQAQQALRAADQVQRATTKQATTRTRKSPAKNA
jgi:hypothetical protein